MSYVKYGISPQLVERIKTKLRNPALKDRVKRHLDGVSKYDLQDRTKVRSLIRQVAKSLNEPLTIVQEDQLVNFVISLKIDPNNTFHLLKLWGMFR
ncbi:stage VI sporulation protein F [Paenibacillus taiwanensis]|uniref:stage VI sporulation protein F n=1 Tax=Paenibacillus taiwanensis TaxID=401638 RepID=UPI00040E7788|nr:stage VI sporulation protein F [Paenibacillus taiwanensis]